MQSNYISYFENKKKKRDTLDCLSESKSWDIAFSDGWK